MGTVRVNSITINNAAGTYQYGPFYQKTSITSVDLGQIPWTNNSMYNAFYGCSNLTTITNINQNITNMDFTFYSCRSLINAPIIPNSVTTMGVTFMYCGNLRNAPIIPSSVSSLFQGFRLCSSLVTAPIIPHSVQTLGLAFHACFNLTGNIYIESNQVTQADSCFYETTLSKNVYIPFTYSNGVNTQTYNSFISAGYKTDGSVCGVYLKDIGTL